MTLSELLECTARRHPEEVFLPAEQPPISYRQFDSQVNRLACGLADLGVRAGERVAIILPNCVELLHAWFAVAKLGAVIVPLNPALVTVETERLLRHAEPTVLIGDAQAVNAYHVRLAPRAAVAVGAGEPATAVSFASLLNSESDVPKWDASPRQPLAILYTSGTTGRPKGCELTHETFVRPAREFVRWMEVTPRDRCLGFLPLFHLAGVAFAVSTVAGGASLVITSSFGGSRFWNQVRHYHATLVRYLGEMLTVLCQQPVSEGEQDHGLRAAYGGGARPEAAETFERRFGVRVVEGYGLTETNTVLRNELRHRVRGSLGRPLPYSEVRVATEEGRELPHGRVGEIQVRQNPVMMTGYFRDPELTTDALVDGWFRTGDLGHRDEHGYFYFEGRTKEIIRRRGENIAPGEIEEVLNRQPDVLLAAVVGVPDEVGGEEIKAYLVLRRGTRPSPEALVRWCQSYLAEFKVPRYFEFCTDLPLTATNKVNKGMLRAVLTTGGPCFDRKNVRSGVQA